ncbi:MAG: ribonuclease HII [Candidatus Onthovivens sp.]
MLDFEEQFYNEKIKVIVGVDEAGRGPLCGPVVAAACILPRTYINEKINDSKKLSEKKRELLYDEIINNALSYGVGIVDSKRIDEINIYEATKEAMHLAISQLKVDYDLILTDAMKLKDEKVDVIDIIKGDAKCQCIAAASIIAKVTRDRILLDMDQKHPEYGFKSHKGYGTKKHIEAIKEHGIIDGFHRETYEPIKSLLLEGKISKK